MRAWIEDVVGSTVSGTTRQQTFQDARNLFRGSVLFVRLQAYLAASYAEFVVLVLLCVAPIADIENLPYVATVVLMMKLLLVLFALREFVDAVAAVPCSKYLQRMAEEQRNFARVMLAIPSAAAVLVIVWTSGICLAAFSGPSRSAVATVAFYALLLANVVVSVDGFRSVARNHRKGYSDVFPEIVRVAPAVYKDLDVDDAQSTCPICLDDFEAEDSAVRLPCKHLFHTDCITGWFQQDLSCPMRCKTAFVRLTPRRASPADEAAYFPGGVGRQESVQQHPHAVDSAPMPGQRDVGSWENSATAVVVASA